MRKITYYVLYTLIMLFASVWVSFTKVPEVIAEELSRVKVIQYIVVTLSIIFILLSALILFLLFEGIRFLVLHNWN